MFRKECSDTTKINPVSFLLEAIASVGWCIAFNTG